VDLEIRQSSHASLPIEQEEICFSMKKVKEITDK
jgi:hypothetical protein